MGVGQQRRSDQGPPSSAGNPDRQHQSPPSAVAQPPASSSGRPPSGSFDGPGETRNSPFGPGMGFDPARGDKKDEKKFNTRVELPCYRENVSNTFFVC